MNTGACEKSAPLLDLRSFEASFSERLRYGRILHHLSYECPLFEVGRAWEQVIRIIWEDLGCTKRV